MLRTGYQALWSWFGLSRAAWLTLPRVLMHEMPDAWQQDMARLLRDWDNTWRGETAGVLGKTAVLPVGARGRFGKWPAWLTDYRHPDGDAIAIARGRPALIRLAVGDPRRAAWLQHMRSTGEDAVAAEYARQRLPLDVEAEWPPESANVTSAGLNLWSIPWGTPEHAAWLAAWRTEGRLGLQKAQAADVACRTLTERSRWPRVPEETLR